MSLPARKKTFLELVRFYVSGIFGEHFNFQVKSLDDLEYHARSFAAAVEARFAANELVDEQETIELPAGPWNQIKDALNQWLEKLDRYGRSRSLLPMPLRFKVQRRKIPVKRVYHA